MKAGYKLFYRKGKGNSAFEFVIEYDSAVIPIDVEKSRGSIDSLDKFKNHNKLFVTIKISENKYGYDVNNKILTVPFYYVPFLINTLQKGEINELINMGKMCN